MSEEKIEAKTAQDIADHFLAQLKVAQEESRDGDMLVLWMWQLAFMLLVEKLNEDRETALNSEEILATATACIDENFEDLKKADGDYHAFQEMFKKAFPKDKGGRDE